MYVYWPCQRGYLFGELVTCAPAKQEVLGSTQSASAVSHCDNDLCRPVGVWPRDPACELGVIVFIIAKREVLLCNVFHQVLDDLRANHVLREVECGINIYHAVGLRVSSLYCSWPGPITASWYKLCWCHTLMSYAALIVYQCNLGAAGSVWLVGTTPTLGVSAGYNGVAQLGSLNPPSSSQPLVNLTWDQHPV